MMIETTMAPCRIHKSKLSMEKQLVKKYKKTYMRKLKEKEYKRLKTVLPTLAEQQKVNKLTVIEEAIRYIDQLHNTLMCRMQRTNPEDGEPQMDHHALVSATHRLFMMRQRAKTPLAPSNDANILQQMTSTMDHMTS